MPNRPTLEIVEKGTPKDTPVLIVDSEGSMGEGLAKKLRKYVFTVLASKKRIEGGENSLAVLYKKTFPQIPQAPYSHIFVFFENDNEIKKTLAQFVKESKKRGVRLIVSTKKETKLLDFVQRQIYEYRENSMIAVAGDVFAGKETVPYLLDALLEEAKKEGRVVVPNMGLAQVYPVFYDDALDLLLEAAFGSKREKEPLLLFQKQPRTLLSILRTLQRVDPMIRIDFKDGGELDGEVLKGQHALSAEYSVDEKIRHAYSLKEKASDGRLIHFLKPVVVSPAISFVRLVVTTFILIFILPLLLSATFALFGLASLSFSVHSLRTGDFSQSAQFAKTAYSSFTYSQNFFSPIQKEMSYVSQNPFFNNALEAGKDASLAVESANEGLSLYENVFSGKSVDPQKDVALATSKIRTTLLTYQRLQVLGFVNSPEGQKVSQIGRTLSSVLDVLPQIIGAGSERTYLVLFQNNMELRPGGGFIGSYGLLKLNKGKVEDLQIHDVYDADGQLKGHVEPPYPIRRYIPMVHWYLRDSNFDIDFPKDAQNAAFFLKEEMGTNVDGVISLDVSMVRNIIGMLGKVNVADFNQEVTADNFYLLTQQHAEKNFFPGSTQKKDFLRSLFLSLENEILTKKNFSYEKIIALIKQGLDQKHLLIAFSDSAIQNVFTVNKFSSSLLQDEKVQGINDFLGINEANLGANKANYFTKRKVTQEVKVEADNNVSERVTLDYFNGSSQWPGGDYKMFVQLVLPQNATVSAISIDGVPQNLTSAITDFNVYEKKGFVVKGLELDHYQELGKEIFGFLTIVPSQKIQRIIVSYKLSSVSLNSSFLYNHVYFKQPGTEEYPYAYTVTFDPTFNMYSIPSNLKKQSQSLSFSKTLTTDENFVIGLTKNQP